MTYEDVRLELIQAAAVLGVSRDSRAFRDAMGVVGVAEIDRYDPALTSEIALSTLRSGATLSARVA